MMSRPDATSEMAYFLQDNMVEFLKGATEEELTEFVNTLLPHISPVGVNRVYPVVSESFPPRTMPQTMEELADDDDLPANYGGTK